jgi:hypothetical protein
VPGGNRYATGAVRADCRAGNGCRPLLVGTPASLDGRRLAGPGSFALAADGILITNLQYAA